MNYNDYTGPWVAVDGHDNEVIFNEKPYRDYPNMDLEVMWGQRWKVFSAINGEGNAVFLPKGTIKHLIGKELTYKDEPVQIKMKLS